MDHAWLGQVVEHRMGDQRVVRHSRKWRKAGVREDGPWRQQAAGTPQGGRARPLVANLSLHSVLDLWAAQWRRRQARGEVSLVRYGDDCMVGFQHQDDAEQCRSDLRERCQRCRLELHPEKTRLSECGRWARARRQRRGQGQPETCDVRGLTHRCGTTTRGKCTVRRCTIAKRLRTRLQEVKQTLRARLHWPIEKLGAWLTRGVVGHDRYSGVPRNLGRLRVVRAGILRDWCRIVRRRSQRHRMPWQRRYRLATQWLPEPHIMHPYPAPRRRVTTRGRSSVRSYRTPGSVRGVPGNWHPYRDLLKLHGMHCLQNVA
jgi:RNA-directed DNA polymerase